MQFLIQCNYSNELFENMLIKWCTYFQVGSKLHVFDIIREQPVFVRRESRSQTKASLNKSLIIKNDKKAEWWRFFKRECFKRIHTEYDPNLSEPLYTIQWSIHNYHTILLSFTNYLVLLWNQELRLSFATNFFSLNHFPSFQLTGNRTKHIPEFSNSHARPCHKI